ncbi:hypothetical protein [Thorsellia kenyensis]|uniref:Uncharacterized protein n=1 Tax=Thorsellia kenyensis TaxID=1549888 RepID=A0ABV6C9D4_9GAMM
MSVDKSRPEKSTSHSPELESSTERVKPSKLERPLTLPTLSEAKPAPPEVSHILISGLQIKCGLRLLAQVLEVVEHV